MTSHEIAAKYCAEFDPLGRFNDLRADIDAALAERDKVIAAAVELASKVRWDNPNVQDKARELLALAEAVKGNDREGEGG